MLRIIWTLALALFLLQLSGQTVLTGSVIDTRGTEIIGANIFLKGTYDGTSSEVDGSFLFTTEETGAAILSISYLGFETWEQSVQLTGDTIQFDVQMQLAANELEMVTITAGSFAADDEKKNVVLNSLDIVTTAGALADITSAMNTLPGTQTVGETGQLFVRGGAAHETRTFIDGMYVQSPFTSTAPNVPARGRFSPFLFKGTMFSTGGYSAEYGQALSSALILNTQDLASETVTGINLMTVGGGLSHTQRWERTSLAVSTDYTNLGPYMNLVPQNIEWEKPVQSVNGQVIFRQKTSETGIFKFQAQGNTSGFIMQYPDAENVLQTNRLELNNDNYFASASYRELLSDTWSLFIGAGYSYNEDQIFERFQVKTNEQAITGKATLQYTPNNHFNFKTGAEYIHNQYIEGFTDNNNASFNTRLFEHYSAAFAEGEWSVHQNLAMRAGLRLENSQLLDRWNIAPRLSLAYKTGEHSQVSLAYGQFYQTPESEQLRYHTDLNFERATHYIANYQWSKDKRIFRVEGYYKLYNDLVKFDPESPWLSQNSGDGYARGFDVFFRDSRSIRNADLWVSYSFLDTERDYLDFPQRATPVFASRHNVSMVGKYWIPGITTTFGATYAFVSPRPFHNPNEGDFNAGRTKPYHDLSLNASYLTHIGRHFTIIHASVSNVLGQDQVFGYQFSRTPDANGQFSSVAIRPPAKQFFFIGMFVSIGQQVTINAEEALK